MYNFVSCLFYFLQYAPALSCRRWVGTLQKEARKIKQYWRLVSQSMPCSCSDHCYRHNFYEHTVLKLNRFCLSKETSYLVERSKGKCLIIQYECIYMRLDYLVFLHHRCCPSQLRKQAVETHFTTLFFLNKLKLIFSVVPCLSFSAWLKILQVFKKSCWHTFLFLQSISGLNELLIYTQDLHCITKHRIKA